MKSLIRIPKSAGHNLKLIVAISIISVCASQSPAFQCLAQMNQIQHIVIIVQEARSFDTMFGAFTGATTGDYLGQTIPLRESPLSSQSLPDNWSATEKIVAAGMDDFYYDGGDLDKSAYVQFPQNEIPNYWAYAQNFALSDNFFASTYGPSFPNVLGNPNSSASWGCDAPAGTTVLLANGQSVFPCFNIPVLPELLSQSAITWKYYSAPEGQPGYVWSTLDAISGIRNSTLWTSNVASVNSFIPDVEAGNCRVWCGSRRQPRIPIRRPPTSASARIGPCRPSTPL